MRAVTSIVWNLCDVCTDLFILKQITDVFRSVAVLFSGRNSVSNIQSRFSNFLLSLCKAGLVLPPKGGEH